jgi:SAM-dependent methyltransferase
MTHDHAHPGAEAPGDIEWDERYAAADQVWSGDPNGALVAEVAGLAPGTALDVGCGEGADAVWLARNGWQVTALDVSRVALERAERHARDAGVSVTWVHSGLVEARLGTFDLVSAQYPALKRTPANDAERALLDAVAPGGVLLVVHHRLEPGSTHGFDPDDYVLPKDVAALLDENWRVETDERRPRFVRGGAGAGHAEDIVLKARRLPASLD